MSGVPRGRGGGPTRVRPGAGLARPGPPPPPCSRSGGSRSPCGGAAGVPRDRPRPLGAAAAVVAKGTAKSGGLDPGLPPPGL